ncbi:MAG: 4-hydroxybenzoate octaprenyltransferase [Neisseriaceae bacterium]
MISQYRSYIQVARLDKPIGIFLLLFPTYWALWLASGGPPNVKILVLFTLGTVFMRSAGCIINDICDSDIDSQVERTRARPLSTGQLNKKEALKLLIAFLFFAALCLFPLNSLTRGLSLVALFLALSYPLTKRFFQLPQLYLGISFSFSIPMAYAAVLNQIPLQAWVLFLANIAWIIGYDTVYAIADKPDDVKLSIHSSAITFGSHDVTAVLFFYILFVGLLVVVGCQNALGLPFWLALMVAVGLLSWQYPKIRFRNRQDCYRAFVSGQYVGLVIWVGILLHYLLE